MHIELRGLLGKGFGLPDMQVPGGSARRFATQELATLHTAANLVTAHANRVTRTACKQSYTDCLLKGSPAIWWQLLPDARKGWSLTYIHHNNTASGWGQKTKTATIWQSAHCNLPDRCCFRVLSQCCGYLCLGRRGRKSYHGFRHQRQPQADGVSGLQVTSS